LRNDERGESAGLQIDLAVKDYADVRTPLLVMMTSTGGNLFQGDGNPWNPQVARLRAMLGKNDNGTGPADAIMPLPDKSPVEHLALMSTDSPACFPEAERLKIAAARAVALARRIHAKRCVIAANGACGASAVPALVEGCLLGDYAFTKYKTESEREPVMVTLLVQRSSLAAARAALHRTRIIGEAVNRARDLVNEPASALGPSAFAAAATTEARKARLKCDILDDRQLRRLNCGGILAVGHGAREAPRLLVLRHHPKNSGKLHVALVGKGVTFDTGGHCLKLADGMWRMKSDMAGGAAVIAAMTAVARLRLPLRVTGIVPIVENAIGPEAMLPGEVIRMANGKTVHVDNTDAEGRLILADALWYARRLGATHVADIATLTGSATRALGKSISALFCDDEEWAARLIKAGAETGELLWRMPLHAEYREMLKHECADMDNTGKSPNAGAIVAALFLKEFVDPALVWAHLDIAGTAMTEKPWKYFQPGATGVGVRTFAALLTNLAERTGQ
jgi:leucyl aminopeptidase